jgi:predicted membrane protein
MPCAHINTLPEISMNIRQKFLLVAAIGLLPIALSYGLMPQKSLSYLFDISVSDPNGIHIFRAVMGLYLALIMFWLIGAFMVQIRQAALYSLIVFMFGLAAGRILSLFIDGVPHWLLVVYLVLELGFGVLGILLIKKSD